MADFQEDHFEQKLLALKDTQDSIQSLSLWCLKHSQQHKKVVSCWLHVLKKVKVEQRVTLFYLANDVIQYSKRKNYPFVESWATALQKATPLVRDDKVKHKILRLFKIWDERNIYDETFLADLSGLLTAHTKKSNQASTVDLVQEFQPSSLFSEIRKCKALEEDTDLKLKIVKECSIPVSDPDALQVVVKDRRNGDDLMQDVEDGIVKLEAYTKALELEIKERIEVIKVLEVSEQFYDVQRGEAKVVCNAYRNFGNRIKTLKRKLEELLPTLPSPVPSPDINAPSPSSESDLDIPDESKTVSYDSEKSFIGTDFVSAMNHSGDNQNQLMRNVSQAYSHANMSGMAYNSSSTNNYDEYSHQTHMNAAPIGYYKNNSQLESESPASPVEQSMGNDSFLYHSEGNPIEVINTSINDNHSTFNASGFLRNIMAANATSSPVPVPPVPAKIPGLESPTDNARNVFSFMEAKSKSTLNDSAPMMWGDKPLTKYQSWPSPDIAWPDSQETPVSPPAFEKESYGNPVEYVDTNHAVVDAATRFLFGHELPPLPQQQLQQEVPESQQHVGHGIDVSHGLHHHHHHHQSLMNHAPDAASDQIATIPLPKHDVDDRHHQSMCSVPNRNLISLTESPSSSNHDSWKTSNDLDYRGGDSGSGIPMPPTPPVGLAGIKMPQDNIESVDMELSDDETDAKGEDRGSGSRHRKSSFKEDNEPPPKSQASAVAATVDAAAGLAIGQSAQLMPPPNPWDMMNVPRMDGRSNGGIVAAGGGGDVATPDVVDFNKLMSTFANPPPSLEPSAQPPSLGATPMLSDFSHFPMPPPPAPQPFGDMRFSQPPLMSIPPPPPPVTDANGVFHGAARPNFGRPRGPPPVAGGLPHNFGPPLPPPQHRPFGFMPNPMLVNSQNSMAAQSPLSTPTKEYSIPPPPPPSSQQQQQPPYTGNRDDSAAAAGDHPFLNNNVEPLFKSHPFDKRALDNGVAAGGGGGGGDGDGDGPAFDGDRDFSSPSKSSVRSNLKEISLSEVLERTMNSCSARNATETGDGAPSSLPPPADDENGAIDHELLFGAVDDSSTEENGAVANRDDGADDLYNNIDDESSAAAADQPSQNAQAADANSDASGGAASVDQTAAQQQLQLLQQPPPSLLGQTPTPDFRFAPPPLGNEFVGYACDEATANEGGGPVADAHTPTRQKAPFQGIVPKASKPLMAPPNLIEDEERHPWPLMPVIDLSDDGNECPADDDDGGGYHNNDFGQHQPQYHHQYQHQQDNANQFSRPPPSGNRPPRFFGGGGGGGGGGRFQGGGQQSPMRGAGGGGRGGGGRYMSNRGDFRPRGGYQMSPNQDQMRRMPRGAAPFQRSQGGGGGGGGGGGNFQNSPRMFRSPRPNRPFRRGW